MRITTRPATDGDKVFARNVHHLAYRDVVVRQFGAWDEGAQDRFFDEDWAAAEFDIILADARPCGYAAVEDRTDCVHVRELVVHPDYQGRGIGSRFLEQVIARAREHEVPVRLGTFLQNRALALYRRLGFREFARTETHVLMEWRDDQAADGANHAAAETD